MYHFPDCSGISQFIKVTGWVLDQGISLGGMTLYHLPFTAYNNFPLGLLGKALAAVKIIPNGLQAY